MIKNYLSVLNKFFLFYNEFMLIVFIFQSSEGQYNSCLPTNHSNNCCSHSNDYVSIYIFPYSSRLHLPMNTVLYIVRFEFKILYSVRNDLIVQKLYHLIVHIQFFVKVDMPLPHVFPYKQTNARLIRLFYTNKTFIIC